jgi:hypothetical protein
MPPSDFGVGTESGEDAMSKKRNTVPKRIGGVKVPKAVRRGLKELAASEDGRTVIADALSAAGAVVASAQARAATLAAAPEPSAPAE